jgi:hypothetical protein
MHRLVGDPELALALLVASVRTDDVNNAATTNDLAVLADLLNGRTDFHVSEPRGSAARRA